MSDYPFCRNIRCRIVQTPLYRMALWPVLMKFDNFPLKVAGRVFIEFYNSKRRVDYGWEPMTEEEQERFSMQEREKMGAYATYAVRDAELKRLMDGSVKPKRARIIHNEKTESRAFKKYLALFYDRPNVPKVS